MQVERYNSLISSRKVQDERIENIVGRMSNESKRPMIDLSENTLIISISKSSCGKCLFRELKYFNNLNQESIINVIGIYNISEEPYLKLLFRSLQINFPTYALVPKEFSKLSFTEHFPQIYFLRNNKIVSSLFPIPGDDEFSGNYYKHLLSVLNDK